ncbi:MAG: hypothetical protein PHW76_07920 [Alphaproteobacteria bacterium]|nr:hypothetical protein [Alphaproteobacteria bacterium]
MSDTLPNESWIVRQLRAFFQSLWEKEIAINVVALAGSVATLMVIFAMFFFEHKMFFFGVASPFFFLTWLSLLFFFSRDILDIWLARSAEGGERTIARKFAFGFDLLTRALIIVATTVVGVSLIYFVFVEHSGANGRYRTFSARPYVNQTSPISILPAQEDVSTPTD